MNESTIILTKAKNRISNPNAWMKGAYSNQMDDTYPTCWCSFGAVDSVAADLKSDYATNRNVLTLLIQSIPDGHIRNVINYNDDPETTHTDVMEMFDRAIELSEDQTLDA